ncbi:hypothetical protein LPJ66_008231 [Kickxella alabastrina]|uniref:Uncharacterized protein n=1 Tax=Kickxella alabastrina TaxID=61397 RepID=A0ACC1IA98_9FUNG|nr:hypothetical protein LPJ66_008231 [Kickxella alabastrina]
MTRPPHSSGALPPSSSPPSSSPLGAGFNLVNTIVGSGILALPYALKEAGFYFGIFTLVAVALLSNLSLNTLIYSGRRTSRYKYESVSAAALGDWGHHVLAFALTVTSLGSCISYLIIIGDLGSSLVQALVGPGSLWASRNIVIIAAACSLALPLLFFRTLAPLTGPSALSIMCLPAIVLIVAVRGAAYAQPEPAPTPIWGPSVLPAIGVIAFAYACQQTCFQSYGTLREKTLGNWAWATRFATATALLIYLAFAIISYRVFGLETQPNLLNNFASDDGWANVARALLAFTLALTYPMQFYPVRDLLADALCVSVDEQPAKFHGITVVMFAATVGVAVAVEDLGFVFKLIGTAASSLMVFGLPGVIYLQLVSPYKWWGRKTEDESALLLPAPVAASVADDGASDSEFISEPSTSVLSVVLLLLGLGVFAVGTWSAVHEYVSSK